MNIKIERDSICLADDVNSPHCLTIDINENATISDFIKKIGKYFIKKQIFRSNTYKM